MKKLDVTTIIFWGATWGIVEATLGWFLHFMHFKGEVMILYPIGLFCMMMAAKQSGKSSAIIQVAIVAALIKLTNLFIPSSASVFRTINPAIAIILEGLVSWGFFAYVQKQTKIKILHVIWAVTLVFVSLFVFRGWQIFVDAFFAQNAKIHQPYDLALFLKWGWRALVQGLMLTGVFYLIRGISMHLRFGNLSERLAIPLFALSVLLNVFI